MQHYFNLFRNITEKNIFKIWNSAGHWSKIIVCIGVNTTPILIPHQIYMMVSLLPRSL